MVLGLWRRIYGSAGNRSFLRRDSSGASEIDIEPDVPPVPGRWIPFTPRIQSHLWNGTQYLFKAASFRVFIPFHSCWISQSKQVSNQWNWSIDSGGWLNPLVGPIMIEFQQNHLEFNDLEGWSWKNHLTLRINKWTMVELDYNGLEWHFNQMLFWLDVVRVVELVSWCRTLANCLLHCSHLSISGLWIVTGFWQPMTRVGLLFIYSLGWKLSQVVFRNLS